MTTSTSGRARSVGTFATFATLLAGLASVAVATGATPAAADTMHLDRSTIAATYALSVDPDYVPWTPHTFDPPCTPYPQCLRYSVVVRDIFQVDQPDPVTPGFGDLVTPFPR